MAGFGPEAQLTIQNSYLRNWTNVNVPTNGSVNGCWMDNKLVVITNTRFDAPPGRSLSSIAMIRDVASAPECLSKLDEARVYAYNGNASDNFQVYHSSSSVLPRPPAQLHADNPTRHQRPDVLIDRTCRTDGTKESARNTMMPSVYRTLVVVLSTIAALSTIVAGGWCYSAVRPWTSADLSTRQLVEPRRLDRAGRSRVRQLHRVHRTDANDASRLRRGRRRRAACRSTAFRTPSWTAPTPQRTVQFQYSDESDGVNHATNQSFPFYPIPDEAITQAHWIEGGEPGNVDLRSTSDRHLLIVDRDRRHLYELYNVFYDGSQWHAGSGAFFDLERERAASRRVDVGRCRRAGDPAGARAVRRGVRGRRDRARVSRDRAGDERLRVSGVAPRGVDGGRAADGRAPAAEGEPRHLAGSRRKCRRSSAR